MTDILTRARAYLLASREPCGNDACIGAEAREIIEALVVEREKLYEDIEALVGECWKLHEDIDALHRECARLYEIEDEHGKCPL